MIGGRNVVNLMNHGLDVDWLRVPGLALVAHLHHSAAIVTLLAKIHINFFASVSPLDLV